MIFTILVVFRAFTNRIPRTETAIKLLKEMLTIIASQAGRTNFPIGGGGK